MKCQRCDGVGREDLFLDSAVCALGSVECGRCGGIKVEPETAATRVAAEDERPSFDTIYMSLAFLMAKRSSCRRLSVGAIITSEDHRQVLAVGYNGNYSGGPNGCDSDEPGACGCIHAEANAIINCTAPRSQKKIAYLTDSPCLACTKMLVNLGGVEQVFYAREYRISEHLRILSESGIGYDQLVHL